MAKLFLIRICFMKRWHVCAQFCIGEILLINCRKLKTVMKVWNFKTTHYSITRVASAPTCHNIVSHSVMYCALQLLLIVSFCKRLSLKAVIAEADARFTKLAARKSHERKLLLRLEIRLDVRFFGQFSWDSGWDTWINLISYDDYV